MEKSNDPPSVHSWTTKLHPMTFQEHNVLQVREGRAVAPTTQKRRGTGCPSRGCVGWEGHFLQQAGEVRTRSWEKGLTIATALREWGGSIAITIIIVSYKLTMYEYLVCFNLLLYSWASGSLFKSTSMFFYPLGPSIPSQMVRYSFLLPSNISLYIWTSFLYPLIY